MTNKVWKEKGENGLKKVDRSPAHSTQPKIKKLKSDRQGGKVHAADQPLCKRKHFTSRGSDWSIPNEALQLTSPIANSNRPITLSLPNIECGNLQL